MTAREIAVETWEGWIAGSDIVDRIEAALLLWGKDAAAAERERLCVLMESCDGFSRAEEYAAWLRIAT